MIRCLLLFLFPAVVCFAGSVRLLNDTAHKLRAVIRGSDGTYLAEVIVNPQQSTSWNDAYLVGQYGAGNIQQRQAARSQTPYTVLWYCLEGNDYAVCDNVATGSTVTALSCTGIRQCKPQQKKNNPEPYRTPAQGGYLQPEAESLEQQPPATTPGPPPLY